MRASEFEFRHRFWFIAGSFFLAFFAYNLDHRNLAVEMLRVAHGGGFDAESPGGRNEVRLVFACGAGLVVLAAWLRTWATAYLTSDVVHDSELRQDALVADGPYRFVRNPLYLGLFVMALGMALFNSRLGAAFLLATLGVFGMRLIGLEEERLLVSSGEGYRAYCARVPRLLPALTPRLPASGRAPRWGQAIVGESFLWIFAAASVAFAFTLDARAFAWTCGGGTAIYFVGKALTRRAT
jgi:protein-S-isoprenylcysteine O-methyltransferase Ste14